MGIVALHAIHPAFDHGMMLRQLEFGVRLQMALETSGGFLSRVHDKFATSPARFDMLAARAVARFATGLSFQGSATLNVHPRVSAGGKHPGDIGMTIETSFVANVMRARNFRGSNNGP